MHRLTLWPKRLLYLACAILALLLARHLSLSGLSTSLLLLPLVALEAILRLLAQRRLAVLDREILTSLQAGRPQELLPLLRRQRLLSFSGPRHVLQAKLGMVHRRLGQHREAAFSFREALEEAPVSRRAPLAIGLADSLYDLGELSEAERFYREAIDFKQLSPHACANIARLIQRRDGDIEEAELYLRQAVDADRGGVLRCELVHLLLALDKVEEASWQLQLAAEELARSGPEEQRCLDQARAALAAKGPVLEPVELPVSSTS